MVNTVIEYLPYLAIAVVINFTTGIYQNINVFGYKFDFKKLVNGIIKMLIIVGSFVGGAFIYEKIGTLNIGTIELTPDIIIISAVIMYFTKGMINLKEILKLESLIKLEEELDDYDIIER